MKRNALIRIVIWSIVLTVLLVILGGGIVWNRRPHSSAIEATAVPMLTEVPVEALSHGAFVTDNVNLRASPSQEATVLTMLEAGSKVTVSLTEIVDGTSWTFITYPQSGWLVSQYISADASIHETMVTGGDPGDKITIPADKVREIEIEWVSGDILIQPGNVEEITFSEDGVTDSKYAMHWIRSNDELKITFCDDDRLGFGFGRGIELEKDLTILVPQDWTCESLSIECASASVEVNDMTIREVDFDGASGACEFENCTVGEIDLDTASGDIRFIGSLESLDCDAASASVYAVLTNMPSRLDLDTMSGDLDITLPENAGFTLAIDAMSNDFESDFETTLKNGNYVCGDGRCRINVDALSGDVMIRKAPPAQS